MTYCVAITLEAGIVFASDSRTNAGVDYVTTFSKMHVYKPDRDRMFVILTAGNLATSQEVLNRLQVDLNDEQAKVSLRTVKYLFDAADYLGDLNHAVQTQYARKEGENSFNPEATFIIGGQIKGQPHGIYMVYPQGNYISASPATPYLQIGESKYGKPILDRVITPNMSLESAGRCALVSIDSTMHSNMSVGPPIELSIYPKESFQLAQHISLKMNSPYYTLLQKRWSQGIRKSFNSLPHFEWESSK